MSLVELSMAYGVAAAAHAGQQRRGNGEPCVNHSIRVAETVSKSASGSNEKIRDLVIAAVLHDVVEDSEVTLEEIGVLFGPQVKNLVDGCTDAPEIADLPRLQRKTAQAEKLRGLDRGVQLIKLADQVDNLEYLSEALDAFETEDAISRVECMVMVARVCKSVSRTLLIRAEKTAQDILDALSSRKEVTSRRVFQGVGQVCPYSGKSGETTGEKTCPEP